MRRSVYRPFAALESASIADRQAEEGEKEVKKNNARTRVQRTLGNVMAT